jgi:fatty acid desaturase
MLPLLLNFGVHRRYHLRHHSFTSRPGDPEYNFDYARFRGIGDYLKGGARWLLVPTPVHCLNWRETAWACLGRVSDFVQSDQDRTHVRWNAALLLAWVLAAVAATWEWPWLVRAYWVPLVCFFPFLTWFTALPEHYGVDSSHDALLNTRSVYTGGLLRRAFWNINLHTAHHYAPSVPFYHLPTLDASLRSRVVLSEPSYLTFHARLLSDLLRPLQERHGRVER